MDVHGADSVGGLVPVLQPHPAHASSLGTTAPLARAGDTIEISEMSRLLDELSRLPEVRQEKVAELRRAIEAGSYEDPVKLEIAAERLLKELRGEY